MTYEISMADKVALVTGARGGIGSVICRKLAEVNAKVVLLDKCCDDEASHTLFDSLPGAGHMMLEATIDDTPALTRLAGQIGQRYGKVDLLVNCAGITRQVAHSNLDGLDDTLIDDIFRINWRGAFAMVRAFRSLLENSQDGTIVNISSIAGMTGIGSNVAYCASKAALDSMTRSLARALAPKIRVVSIAPGWVEGEYANRMDPTMVEEQRRWTPLGRLAQAQDVANAILAIATLLTFSTGCIIPVDGGRPLN